MANLFESYAESVKGKTFACYGVKEEIPPLHQSYSVEALIIERFGHVTETVNKDTNYLVLGPARQKGRAAAIRAAKTHEQVTVLEPRALYHLLRPDLGGKTFAFIGGFGRLQTEIVEEAPALLEAAGASVSETVNESVDFLVVGAGRKKGKTAAERIWKELVSTGHQGAQLSEVEFGQLIALLHNPADQDGLTLARFINDLQNITDMATGRKIERALKMLQEQSMRLYSDITEERIMGVVRSQSAADTAYGTYLTQDGDYHCTQLDLDHCMGMQGGICKHLIMLVLALCKGGELEPAQAWAWLSLAARKGNKPCGETGPNAEIILRYKGVEAGEIDWRPTDTVPEDYYAL